MKEQSNVLTCPIYTKALPLDILLYISQRIKQEGLRKGIKFKFNKKAKSFFDPVRGILGCNSHYVKFSIFT